MKKIRVFLGKYLGIVKKYFFFWIWWVLDLGMGVYILSFYSTRGTYTVLNSPFRDFIIMFLAALDYFCLPVAFIGFTVCVWIMSMIALRKIMKKDQQGKDINK